MKLDKQTLNFQKALETQKGAQFFKSYNNSLVYKHNIAQHFFYLGQKSLQEENEKLEKYLQLEKDKNNNQRKILEYLLEYCPDEYEWVLDNYKR